GALGSIRVSRGCVALTGTERMVCRGRYASAPRAGSRSTETFGAIGLAAGFGTAAGSEMGGRSRGGTYQVNSICTGARSWAVAGRNPQIGRNSSVTAQTCHRQAAKNPFAGNLPRIHLARRTE